MKTVTQDEIKFERQARLYHGLFVWAVMIIVLMKGGVL